MDFYSIYKPLKNHLGKVNLAISLYVVWAYSRNLEDDRPFPADVEVVKGYAQQDHIQKTRHVSFWELELLCRELILNSYHEMPGVHTLAKSNYFARAINKIKDIEGYVGKNYISTNNVLKEFRRLSHRQFPWQSKPNSIVFARHYKIFGNAQVSNLVQRQIGLDTNTIYLIGILLWGNYHDNFALWLPPNIQIPEITTQSFDTFLGHFSIKASDLKELLKNELELNERYAYAYHSFRRYPILETQFQARPALICPIPSLFFQQILAGIYYAIVTQSGFDAAFGNAFQSYIGEVLYAANVHKLNVFPEEKYGHPDKDTIDWIIEDKTAALFIECKTKRMTLLSKSELLSDIELEKDLNKMAGFIVQVYKTIIDYQNNLYPTYKYQPNKPIYPLVVTLEDWYLFGDELLNKLDNIVQAKLKEANLPSSLTETMPYSICSSSEFEGLVQIIQTAPIQPFMEGKSRDKELSKWAYSQYMRKSYPAELEKTINLFPSELDKILPERFRRTQ